MALTAMHITRDPTGAIGIGFTDTGSTIEKSCRRVIEDEISDWLRRNADWFDIE